MHEEDEYGFWDDDGWSTRVHLHHRPESLRGHAEPHRKNPLWGRLGALLAAGVLAIPVAVMLRGSDDSPSLAGQQSPVTDQADAPSSDVAQAPAVTALPPATPETTAASTSPPVIVEQVPAVPAPEAVPPLQAEPKVETVQSVAPTTAKPATTVAVPKKRPCAISYKPVAGDYWILVARKVSVKLSELLDANDATTDTPIYPGFAICLPADATPPTAAATAAPTTQGPASTTAKATSTSAKPTTSTAKPTVSAVKPTSTTAAPTTVAPPVISYSREQVAQIIRDIWPDELEDEAIRIATRESNLVPAAKNSCCYGLFQIYYGANRNSLKNWGVSSASMLLDPKVNAYAAYAIYMRAGGWGPWQ